MNNSHLLLLLLLLLYKFVMRTMVDRKVESETQIVHHCLRVVLNMFEP